ncbi:hypothetical protein BJY01DRAFT_151535 [Aspergillus pseudoustus]|uniref:GPI anchored protein n=1 Tax=Aspergillus pseudoustus TaxID=1810923 RepID=A0ABR4IDR7_9EURO
MKGLHGGIPLAVLAAAAHAQAQGMGGSRGTDIGNIASIPTENTASTTVSEEYNDDHSFELEHEIQVYPQGKDRRHDKRSANAPDGTGSDGAGEIDIGNDASIPTVNKFSSSFTGKYNDDNSIDIDKTTIIKGQKDQDHWRRDDDDDKFPEVPEGPTAVDGPDGIDIGNIADIPTVNDSDASVSETSNDDHSVDVDKTTVVKSDHERRGTPVVDVGSSTFIPTVNEYSASFKGKYNDDHSVDIDKTTIIKKPSRNHDEHPALGFHHPMHHARDERPTTSDGVDIGNKADIPTLNSFTSDIDAEYNDNHSVDISDKTKIIKPAEDHHEDEDHHGDDHHDDHEDNHEDDQGDRQDWKRAERQGDQDSTAVRGAHGVDIGNNADIPTVNSFTSDIDEVSNDNHSVDIKKTKIIKPADDHHEDEDHHGDDCDDDREDEDHHDWKRAERQGDQDPTATAGAHGIDIGNKADIPTFNSVTSDINKESNDNHSVNIDKTKIIKLADDHNDDEGHQDDEGHDDDEDHHEWKRAQRRGDQDPTAVGGAHGVDIGNKADIPTFNSFTSDINKESNDNHSVNIDKTKIIKPAEDHHEDEDHHGDDHDDDHEDNHEDEDHHDWKRAQRQGDQDTQVADGPQGVDVGNKADIPTLNSFTSDIDEKYNDDHSVDIKKTKIIKPAEDHRDDHEDQHDDEDHHDDEDRHEWKRAQRQGDQDITDVDGPHGTDIGNVFTAPTVNKFNAATEENVNDDHSVKVHSFEVIKPSKPHWEGSHGGQPHFEGHGEKPQYDEHDEEEEHAEPEPEPVWHGRPAPPAAGKPEESECAQVHEVVHTVTSTRTEYQTQTAVVYPHETHSGHNSEPPKDSEQGKNNNWGNNTPKGEDDSQKPSDSDNNESPSESGNDNNTPKDQDNSQWESNPSSESNEEYPTSNSDSNEEEHGAFATPSYHGVRTAAVVATPTRNNYHAPPTSAAVASQQQHHHQQASSTFAVVPVQVASPSGTPRAHGSVVIAASSSTPVGSSSSALRAMHKPTGASAEHSARPSEIFTGAGARGVASVAGLFSALAGVFVLLAFAM